MAGGASQALPHTVESGEERGGRKSAGIFRWIRVGVSLPLGRSPSSKRPRESDSAEKLSVQIHGRKLSLCKHYLQGTCKKGSSCPFLHDPWRKNRSLCKAFIRGYCARVGEKRALQTGFAL